MNFFLIPLSIIPQSFNISLGDINYIMTCRWNDADDAGWCLDLQNADTNDYIVTNIPLITGADLLSGLEYLGIQGSFIVYTDGDDTAVPSLTNLGIESNLYFVTTGAASA